MSKKSFRRALVVVLATFVLLAAVGVYVGWQIWAYRVTRHAGKGMPVTVTIDKGMKFPQVARALEKAGVISRPTWFRWYAMHRGLANQVKAGTYVLRDDMTPRDVLDTLVKGVKEVEVDITIPEGKNVLEVCAIIDASGVVEPVGECQKVVRDAAWLKDQGIDGETAEGYLYPDTYRLKKPTPVAAVLARLVREHRAVYAELAEKHARRLERVKKQVSFGDRELVVMASIVEREAVEQAERPRIASVFYNRLTFPSFKSRRLETDPTIRYGCTVPLVTSEACKKWDPAGRLHRAQLDDAQNPYNTYQHAGLPPGPISNPGRASLAAAMAPETTEYLYFVAKDARTHVFSKTYAEHTRWVNQYQR